MHVKTVKPDGEPNKAAWMAQGTYGMMVHYLMTSHLTKGQPTMTQATRREFLATAAGMQQDHAFWLRVKGKTLLQTGRYEAALAHFGEALDIYQVLDGKTERVEALHDMGDLYLRLGDSVSAESHYREAARIAKEIGLARGITRNLLALGDIERRRGGLARACLL